MDGSNHIFLINKEIYDLVQISRKTINSVGSILTVHIRKLYCWDHLSLSYISV